MLKKRHAGRASFLLRYWGGVNIFSGKVYLRSQCRVYHV